MAHSRRRVRRAVVLAAGYGTRLLPATKAQPKEALPLVDKPIIQYTGEEAAASGLTQVIIVTAAGKRAIEDHFDRSLEIEMALQEKGDLARLEEIRRISELADIVYVRQKEQRGVGDAVLTAPDDVILATVPVARQMLDVSERYRAPILAVEEVPAEEIESYGVVEPEMVEDTGFRVRSLVERPSREEAPSNLGIVGRYVLTPDIFEALARTAPGKGREVQITEGLALLLERGPVYAYRFEGKRYDTGRPLGLLKASVEIALRRPDTAPAPRRS